MLDLNKPDEYRERGQNAPLWFFILVWLGWVLVTVAGYLAGQWLSERVAAGLAGDTAARRVLSIEGRVEAMDAIGYAVALLSGVISGVTLGLAQGLLLLPFLKGAGAVEWVLATMLGRATQWMVIYSLGLETARLTFDKSAAGVFLLFALMAAMGILSGAALGFPQSQVFKRRAHRHRLWLIVSILGPLITSLIIAMTLFIEAQNIIRDSATLLTAFLASIATAFALLELLQHPKSEAEWHRMLTWRRPERTIGPVEETVLGSALYAARPETERATDDE